MTKADRYECLKYLASRVTDELVVSGLGYQEWLALTEGRAANCSNGHLGTTVGTALGIAVCLPHRKVLCLTSDGDLLLELSALPPVGQVNPANLVVIVNDNESYQTISKGPRGYWPTLTASSTSLEGVAKACGITAAVTVRSTEEFKTTVDEALSEDRLMFIVMKTEPGPFNAVRPDIDGIEAKYRFARYIESTETVSILPRSVNYRQMARSDVQGAVPAV